MYHHFKGKPDLAPVAIRRTAEELRDTAEGVLGGPGTPYQRIEAYLLREGEVLRGCPLGRLTMDPDVIANDGLRAPVDETLDAIRELIAGIVEEGYEEGAAAGSPPRFAVRRRQPVPEGAELAEVMADAVRETGRLAGEDGAVLATAAVDTSRWLHLSAPGRGRLARGRQW
ncbi:DUF4865 family protein [Streptomyces sp. NPDC101152]|uniref:DUF4865 family protein n=1 Tax=Streptomyces sp. NPDC101152 TaxID=3366116 RepID=UPI003802CCE9